ncbi:MAG: NnrU family protein [Labilithrix sp.]|nr:NnrU family protein [Labilithrix sp.]MCW5816210.1 NnrU family protein [Labilithrix sp.]
MPSPTDAQRGVTLLRDKGCLTCHSVDGTARTGPTFKALWGRKRPVASGGDVREVVVDEAYLARSIREPDAEVVAGYRAGTMPRADVTDDEVHAMALALQDPTAFTSAPIRGGSVFPLASAAAAFVLLHFALSSIPVRTQLIAALKAKGFGVVYSLLALGAFAAMLYFYRTAPYVELWSPPRWTRWAPVLTMPIATLLLVAGYSIRNPTAAGQEGTTKGARPKGILAVTRHPALWGFALWALSHLATNGELHVVIVAAAILVLALGGMLHIDARRKATQGADWDAYAAQTSVVPFAAIAGGRAKLVPSEIGVIRVAIAAFVYLAFFFAHPHVIGASPVP